MTCPTLWKCLEQSIPPWWGTHPGGHCRNPDQGCGESVERCSCLEFLWVVIVSAAAEKRRQMGSIGRVPTLLSGQQAGLRSTGWGPGSGGRQAGLLRLSGGGQRERTELAPEFKENCWELWAELKPVISPSPLCLIATLSGLFLMIGFIWLPLEGRGAAASGPATRRNQHFPRRLLLFHL